MDAKCWWRSKNIWNTFPNISKSLLKGKKGIYVGGKCMPKRGVSKQNLYIKGKKLDALKGWLPVKKVNL